MKPQLKNERGQKGSVAPRPKSKVPLAADRLPEAALDFIHEKLRGFVPDAEIAREVNRRWPKEIAELYRRGMQPKHVGAFRRHRYESLRGTLEEADKVLAAVGLARHPRSEAMREILQRVFVVRSEKFAQADLALLMRALMDRETVRLRERQLDQEQERLDLERQKFERMAAAGKKLVAGIEKGARSGSLKRLAAQVKAEFGLDED